MEYNDYMMKRSDEHFDHPTSGVDYEEFFEEYPYCPPDQVRDRRRRPGTRRGHRHRGRHDARSDHRVDHRRGRAVRGRAQDRGTGRRDPGTHRRADRREHRRADRRRDPGTGRRRNPGTDRRRDPGTHRHRLGRRRQGRVRGTRNPGTGRRGQEEHPLRRLADQEEPLRPGAPRRVHQAQRQVRRPFPGQSRQAVDRHRSGGHGRSQSGRSELRGPEGQLELQRLELRQSVRELPPAGGSGPPGERRRRGPQEDPGRPPRRSQEDLHDHDSGGEDSAHRAETPGQGRGRRRHRREAGGLIAIPGRIIPPRTLSFSVSLNVSERRN